VKSWVFHGAAPIHKLILTNHKNAKENKTENWFYIAGGTGQGEVTVWDVEEMVCKEVYRTGISRDIGSKSTTLIDLDDEKPGGMLGRFAVEPTASSVADGGIRAMVVMSQAVHGLNERRLSILTAGPDWKVRFWDATQPKETVVVSGMDMDEMKPTYHISQPSPDTIIVSERLSQPQAPATTGGRDSRSSNSSAKRLAQKPQRSTPLISLQQQQLLRGHLDTIMDVALIELPYGMVISADRSGVVYLFM
jgi:phosphoinositide-3-kinase regulatory subunit 4